MSGQNLPEKEKEILAFWEQNDIFKKTLQKESPKGSFVFFEGPPTANGKPGIHHAESRAFKDCIPRFKTMQGYHVARKGGWDTHGLPVELEVEKKLEFQSKAQIEEFGIETFNAKCKESVWEYKQNWEAFTKRLGFWVDLENAYITYKPEYVESLWWIVKQVWDKGLLYKDYRVTPHCPRCGTSLSSHELSQGYKDVKDLTITAEFVVKEGSHEALQSSVRTSLLAWTTTPWTLPGNVGLAVGEDLEYVVIEKDDEGAEGRVRFVVAKALLEKVFEGSSWDVIAELKGSDLVGTVYKPLYPFLAECISEENTEKLAQNAYKVYAADFVTTEDGTGIVHTAVMYGQDDFVLGHAVGLPKQHIVKLDGTFIEGTGFLAGRFVRDEDVAIDIIKDLARRGLLFAKAKYEHSYPFCWRCKSPVIYYAKDSWYIRMSSLRDQLLAANETINWEPAHLKEGRFGEWLREVKDWAFSRERYWGTPLPIWESEEGDRLCIGSFEELRSLAKDKTLVGETFDPHRPFVDDIILEKDGKEYTRVNDVCDVWFDSGAMPFAQHHYPFENKELVDSGEAFPADYISEAIDQTRGWFYTLLAVSTLLDLPAPYKNVVSLGHVLDAEGKKMSKSLGNIVEPMEMMEKYGADAVRWYMYTINSPGEGKRFDEKTLQDMIRKNFNLLLNVTSFYELYAGEFTGKPEGDAENVLDQWILARLHECVTLMTHELESYHIMEAARAITQFIDDLSTWYVRRSRDRMKGEDAEDKQWALWTLRECLLTLSKLMAPFTPFIAEQVYGRVSGEKESVHLDTWPEANESLIREEVLTSMAQTRMLVTRALEARVKEKVNVRQPLGSLVASFPGGVLEEAYVAVLKEEVNVKEVELQTGDVSVELNTELTDALKDEGLTREIIRCVNGMRKKAGLTLDDRISLFLAGPEALHRAVRAHEDVLRQGVLATDVSLSENVSEDAKTLSVQEMEISLWFIS